MKTVGRVTENLHPKMGLDIVHLDILPKSIKFLQSMVKGVNLQIFVYSSEFLETSLVVFSNILEKGNLQYFSSKNIGQTYYSVHCTLIKLE